MTPGFRVLGVALLLGGAFFLSAGCAAPRPARNPPAAALETAGPTRVLQGVPFLPQEEDTCGPSSLAMLLRFHGKKGDARELAGETRTAGLRGTLITDLAAAARRRGLPAEVTELDLPGLKGRIVAGEPVILLVDLGLWAWSRPHYLIAYGVTPDGVVAHSGRTEGAVIPYDTLDGQWAKMGRLAIVVAQGGAK
ncbi:MAG: peptidase, family [Deltaproteobacteria bacterium]|nr:peptidase, family [Deltaproteobacteria bacterium]